MPGKFHPIHLGDAFKDEQYQVIGKLGDGSNSKYDSRLTTSRSGTEILITFTLSSLCMPDRTPKKKLNAKASLCGPRSRGN